MTVKLLLYVTHFSLVASLPVNFGKFGSLAGTNDYNVKRIDAFIHYVLITFRVEKRD